jgi:hypothetical protein
MRMGKSEIAHITGESGGLIIGCPSCGEHLDQCDLDQIFAHDCMNAGGLITVQRVSTVLRSSDPTYLNDGDPCEDRAETIRPN